MRNCSDPDPKKRRHFEQPVIQTLQMFVGEMACWLVVGVMSIFRRFRPSSDRRPGSYQAVRTTADEEDEENDNPAADTESIRSTTPLNPNRRRRHRRRRNGHNIYRCDNTTKDHKCPSVLAGWRVTLLALPAVCDILGTTLMNAGLLLVAASIYQMTRGALVLFVGLFSVMFLRRRLYLFQWLSLVGVVIGVGIVGLAGAIQPDPKHAASGVGAAGGDELLGADALRVIMGVLMIAGAQIFTATQFVLEEWILERSAIEPIKVVGWEGVFGFIVTLLGMAILHLTIGRTEAGRYGPFDMVEGWRQFSEHRPVFISSILIMVSIG